ncbi:MAG: PHP domain-containing protein [candidate division WOR-3 bacterium]
MIHLHLHTSYSLWDGYGDVDEYKDYVGSLPFALTEHNNMFSYIKFKRAGLNCYAGVELGILDNSAHITLLAKNERGFARLNQLTAIPKKERGLSHVFDEEYANDIIILTGCCKTYFNSEERRLELLEYFRRGFDIVVECVMYPNFEHIFIPNLQFAKQNGLPFVFTNDVHFLRKEHWIYNDIVNCINSKAKFNDPERFRYDTGIFFMNEDEFIKRCEGFGIERTDVLRSFKEAERVISRAYNGMPQVKALTFDIGLREYIAQNKVRDIDKKYERQLEREIEIIERKGYKDVFILAKEILKLINENGIVTNYGRGSASASLVSYVLGITHVAPFLYNLDFGRFINEYRNDLPDIDIDVPSRKRDYITTLIQEKYGQNVTRLHTLARFSVTTIASDLSRVFDIDYEAKSVDNREFVVRNNLYEYVKALEGKPRHSGTHPAGLCFGENIASVFANVDTEDSTYLNLTKIDILGSGTMDIIQTYYERDGINYIMEFDTFKIKEEEIDICGVGKAGVFQVEGESCGMVTDLIKPKRIGQMIDVTALARAPSLANETHLVYHQYRAPSFMKELFPETRGVIIYQEQLLEILRNFTSFDGEKIEQTRRIISKLKVDEFERVLGEIKQELLYHFNPVETEQLIHHIEDSAQYMFNKAHATSYAHLTFLTAKLKRDDYAKYVTYYLNAIDDDERRMRIIAEAKQRGVFVHLPKLTMASEYNDDFAMLRDGNVYITDKAMKFRARKDVSKLLREYAEKMLQSRKTFGFYPFRIHSDIKRYKRKYIFTPLTEGSGTFVTLCYVVSFYPNDNECIVTDGYSVIKCYIRDSRINEVIRNSEKTKNTIVVKIERKPGYKDTIIAARVLDV